MKRFRSLITATFALIMVIAGVSVEANAQRKNERQVRDLIRSLDSKIDDFQSSLDYQLRSSSADQQEIEDLMNDLRSLKDSVANFQNNLDTRRENRDDVTDIIDAAGPINAYLAENGQNGRIDSDWNAVRSLIDRLSANYGITPDWTSGTAGRPQRNYPDDRTGYPNRTGNGRGGYTPPPVKRTPTSTTPTRSVSFRSNLTGTYRLDPSRSDSTDQVIAETNVGQANRQDLQEKLEAPQEIALDVSGDRVILASSKAAPVTVIADGREKTDQDASGRTIRLRATLKGDELNVSSLGGDSDYTITFTSQDNGRSMKVTRRITTEYLSQTVFADSLYTKTDQVAGLGIQSGQPNDQYNGGYSSSDPNDRGGNYGGPPTVSPGRTGDFIIPNGTILTGMLENNIDTKVSQNNDRFRLTVQSPLDYRGAVIEGHISGVGRSGRVSGYSNVTFNFETITLRNGQKYDFAGFLQSIKDQNGKEVKVDTEGTAKSGSQTKQTVTRGGIGAGAGAIIGAIIGGGKGAAIGAVIGGGAGAGSVIVQGRDDIQLMKGSTLTIQASAPVRNEQAREN